MISSSNNWVIDSSATDHTTGNHNIFSTFQWHKAPSPVTVAHGSTCNIVGFGTVKATSSFTCPLYKIYRSWRSNWFVWVNLLGILTVMFRYFLIIGCLLRRMKLLVIDGLYILDEYEFRFVVYSSVLSPFETHCRLGHPSLALLKKLCPHFQNVPYLERESCRETSSHHIKSKG